MERGRRAETLLRASAVLFMLLPLLTLASAYYLMQKEIRISPQPPPVYFLLPPICTVSREQSSIVWSDFDEPKLPSPG